MRKLQQKIKRLEACMNKNRIQLQADMSRLKRYTHTPAFIVTGVISGFVGGFLLARKKTTPQLIQTARSAASLARKMKRGVKFLSFLIF